LIDGGPAGIYKESLQPRIAQIRQGRKLDEDKPLPVELVMVSHIDDDHIRGLLALFKDLADAKRERRMVALDIASVWHNSFAKLLQAEQGEAQATVAAAYGTASLAETAELPDLNPDVAKVLASVSQGVALENYATQLGLVNVQSKTGLIVADKSTKPIELENLTFTILGPQETELQKLRAEYKKWLAKRSKQKAGEKTAAYEDDSPFNLSSIVTLVESGRKRMLLTGDARGDLILQGLETAGKIKAGGTLHVDVLKVPHHGSDRNLARDFFERVTADHYVFSGDGQHGNPERATLEMLAEVGKGRKFQVHLTYPIEKIDAERKKNHDKEPKKNGSKLTAWSDAKQSLGAFLKKNEEFAKKLRFVPDNGDPHTIDLEDKLGY
jgi:hypothetical protein